MRTVIVMQDPDVVTALYRSQGRRLTRQRRVLFDLIHGNATHPTVEALHTEATRRLPGISLRTVYQTLDELAALGQIQLVRSVEGPLRFDPNLDDHHHAVCGRTGEVFDVYVDNVDALRAHLPPGFHIEQVSIVFRGQLPAAATTPSSPRSLPSRRSATGANDAPGVQPRTPRVAKQPNNQGEH